MFRFLDQGKEIDTSQLENPDAKSLLLRILGAIGVQSLGLGKFCLENRLAKGDMKFYKMMRALRKGNYGKISDYLEKRYPLESMRREEMMREEEGKGAEVEEEDGKGEPEKDERFDANRMKTILQSGKILGFGIGQWVDRGNIGNRLYI